MMSVLRHWTTGAALVLLTASAPCAFAEGPQAAAKTKPSDAKLVERGRYLVRIAGCNDATRRAIPVRRQGSRRKTGSRAISSAAWPLLGTT